MSRVLKGIWRENGTGPMADILRVSAGSAQHAPQCQAWKNRNMLTTGSQRAENLLTTCAQRAQVQM